MVIFVLIFALLESNLAESWPSRREQPSARAVVVSGKSTTVAHQANDGGLPFDTSDKTRIQQQLRKTSTLAIANLLFNLLRPDTWLPLAVRLPRAIWEMAIATTCFSSIQTQSTLLLLSVMTLSTALMDMFVGAPLAAFFVQWKTCYGGGLLSRRPRVCAPDLVKGYGRLFVTLQCAVTGIVYLETAMVTWDAYHRRQRAETVQLQREAMQQVAVTLKDELKRN